MSVYLENVAHHLVVHMKRIYQESAASGPIMAVELASRSGADALLVGLLDLVKSNT